MVVLFGICIVLLFGASPLLRVMLLYCMYISFGNKRVNAFIPEGLG